jgi:hypothetical protein
MTDKPSIREANTINAFTNPESDTFGNQTRSYEKFYKCRGKTAQQAASRLFARSRVCKEIERRRQQLLEIDQKKAIRREITGQYADNATVETYARAVEAGDITNQVACCRILQQRCGQLSDRLVVDVEDSRRLDESHKSQAKRIASFMVQHGLLTQANQRLIPASFELVPQPAGADNPAAEDIPPVVPIATADGNNEGEIDNSGNNNDLQE